MTNNSFKKVVTQEVFSIIQRWLCGKKRLVTLDRSYIYMTGTKRKVGCCVKIDIERKLIVVLNGTRKTPDSYDKHVEAYEFSMVEEDCFERAARCVLCCFVGQFWSYTKNTKTVYLMTRQIGKRSLHVYVNNFLCKDFTDRDLFCGSINGSAIYRAETYDECVEKLYVLYREQQDRVVKNLEKELDYAQETLKEFDLQQGTWRAEDTQEGQGQLQESDHAFVLA